MAGARPDSQGPEKSRRAGRLHTLASYLVGAVAVILFFTTWRGWGKIDNPVVAAVAFALFFAAFWLHERGKRHLQPDAHSTLASDRRPPILYLRSFDDDEKAGTDEFVLAKIFEEVGPFVAIGRPGDKLPPLGASRFYVADDTWRGAVDDLLGRAALVLLRAGKTQGLLWELQQCRKRLSPKHLAVLIPREKEAYETFRRAAAEAGLNVVLPAFPADRIARFKSGELAAIMHFTDDWRGVISVFERAVFKGSSYEFATAGSRRGERFRLALQPVAERAGLAIARPKTNFVAMAVWIYLALMVIFLAVMGFLGLNGYLGN